MVAIAAADGRLDAREVRLIQQVYQERTGRPVDAGGVARAAEAYASKRDVLAELSAAAGGMSRETKEEIIRAAYLVLLADDRIAGEERKKLKDIAAALQVPEIHWARSSRISPSGSRSRRARRHAISRLLNVSWLAGFAGSATNMFCSSDQMRRNRRLGRDE